MKTILSVTFLLSLTFMYGQTDVKKSISDADYFYVNEQYDTAMKLYVQAFEADTLNYNLAYKIASCYFKMPNKIWKAIPYYEKAAIGVSPEYNDKNSREKRSPENTLFFLAYCYHMTLQTENAIRYYSLYLSSKDVNEKLRKEATQRISACENIPFFKENPKKVEISNLGVTINTEFNEFNPCVSANDSVMYFTKEVFIVENNFTEKQYRIMKSFREEDDVESTWEEPIDITSEIITEEANFFTVACSDDGNTLLLFKTNSILDIYKSELGIAGSLYVTTLKSGRWSRPEIIFDQFEGSRSECYASFSSDGRTIYFSAPSKNNSDIGGTDIFYVSKNDRGNWGDAKNLGSAINTTYDETTPCIVNDTILYFSSKGHKGIGGYDIFKSVKGENGVWGEPVNLSFPINSPADDIFIQVVEGGKKAYYAAERPEGYFTFGGKDIYEVVFLNQ